MNKSSINNSVKKILERDLNKVINEIQLFENDKKMWVISGSINNSAGNLALHIAGAVNHFIGNVLGNNDYVRTRDKEFSEKNLPKELVTRNLRQAIETVQKVLPLISEQDMQNEFPEKLGGVTMTIEFFLIHLISHINYHLGQVNYHRRLLDEKVKDHVNGNR
jgi:uncharacterized damage-inducible protein DinB